MKLDATLFNIGYDFKNKQTKIEFCAYGDITNTLEKYLDQKVEIELKKEKRSHDANGYLWVLLSQLQEKLQIPKEELYREYIHNVGSYEVVPIKNEAVNKFIESWQHNGLGWVCEQTKSKLDGYTNVLAYYGTSTYSKEEMARLLDQVVQDCVEQEIPTKRKEDLESLLEGWK